MVDVSHHRDNRWPRLQVRFGIVSAPQAEFDIAQGFVRHGRYDQAIARLKALIGNEEYAQSKQVADARKLLGHSYFAQKKFTEAIAAWLGSLRSAISATESVASCCRQERIFLSNASIRGNLSRFLEIENNNL